jgi:hypothetical protein
MTYDPNIPLAADLLSDSQADLLANFGQLNTQFGVNHVAFNDVSADKGKHKFVQFVRQATAPATASIGASEIVMYGKADGTDTELYGKMTRDNLLYLGMHPVAALTWEPPSTVVPASAFNIASIATTGTGLWTITYTNPVTKPDGSNTNFYMWSVSAFLATGSGGCIATAQNDATYANVVTSGSIKIQFRRTSTDALIDPVGASLIVWKFQ